MPKQQDLVLILERVVRTLNSKDVTCEASNTVGSSQQSTPLSVQCTTYKIYVVSC